MSIQSTASPVNSVESDGWSLSAVLEFRPTGDSASQTVVCSSHSPEGCPYRSTVSVLRRTSASISLCPLVNADSRGCV